MPLMLLFKQALVLQIQLSIFLILRRPGFSSSNDLPHFDDCKHQCGPQWNISRPYPDGSATLLHPSPLCFLRHTAELSLCAAEASGNRRKF